MIHAQDKPAADNAVKVVVTGMNYCVPCVLKEQGAAADCGDTCPQFALKVTDIRDGAGNYVRGFVNKTVYYLGNPKSAELTGNQALKDKAVTIEGTLFKDERVLDVATFKEAAGGGATGVTMSGQVGAPKPAAPAAGAAPAAPAEPAAPAQK
jgi:hypothetical protein